VEEESHYNIFNICNEWDMITCFPMPGIWPGDWQKYGQTLWFNDGSRNDESLGAHNPRLAIDHLRNVATPALGESKEQQFMLTSKYCSTAEMILRALLGKIEVEEVISNYVAFTLEEMETICELFDVEFYAENNPTVVALYGDSEAALLNHFLSAMSANYALLDTFTPAYNSVDYFTNNQDAPSDEIARLKHFLSSLA